MKFGVTHCLNVLEEPVDKIREMTDGGVHYAFECMGSEDLTKAALDCCHEGWGKAVVTGGRQDSKKRNNVLSVNLGDFLHSGKTLVSAVFGGYKGRTHINDLVSMYMEKKPQLDAFTTHTFPLVKINEGMQLLGDGGCLKCIINMSGDAEEVSGVNGDAEEANGNGNIINVKINKDNRDAEEANGSIVNTNGNAEDDKEYIDMFAGD